MKYVLDACVALKWVFRETDSDKALALRDGFRQAVHSLLAPDVFPAEVAHAITRAERRRIVSPPDGSVLLASLLTALPRLHPSVPLLPRAFLLASTARISLYDCLYVALAEAEQCELVTADMRLVNVLQRQFPFIVPLASLR